MVDGRMDRRGRPQIRNVRAGGRSIGRQSIIATLAAVGPPDIIHKGNLQESLTLNKDRNT